jgi:aldose 1-epimerase
VSVLTYGATVQSLRVPAVDQWIETVVGFDDIAAYEASASYPGCIIGRVANRIARATFRRGERTYYLTANEGVNCLHGGARGLSRRVWQASTRLNDTDPIAMHCTSPAGEDGFPGMMHAAVTFALADPMSLIIRYQVTVDQDCPIDLTHHVYFNLGGEPIEGHLLRIRGQWVQELDAQYLATGRILSVRGTPFDLRKGKTIGQIAAEQHPQLTAIGLNQNWILPNRSQPSCTLTSLDGGLVMDLHSDNPCLQVWTGLPRAVFSAGAVALEPQGFIDAVNHSAFPSPWLRPGEVYERSIVYRFRQAGPSQARISRTNAAAW